MENQENKNDTMTNILNNAKTSTSNKSYKAEDEKEPKKKTSKKPVKKETGTAGRKKVADKKKPRQVFYNEAEFSDIEEVAEALGMDTKSFMMMAINQKVKQLQKED
ncbi:MAG: hypothetical protein DRG78_17335 [Epsilonproteobacteria bacterium]|nr:MAG: hypothetical protein DRG78_17335 [Campylobacterota bacterium]